jgi:hypothetical protein
MTTTERVGAPVGYGFSLVDTTPFARGKHHLEFVNGRVLWADNCDLRLAKDRERCVDDALATTKRKRKPTRDKMLAVLIDFYAASTAQRPEQPDQPEDAGDAADPRPWLPVNEGDLSLLTRNLCACIAETNTPTSLFTYGEMPARIEVNDEGTTVIAPLDTAGMVYEIAERVRPCKMVNHQKVVVPPPALLVQNYLARRQRGLPHLRGTTDVPVFAPNGELVTTAGYDVRTKLYYVRTAQLPIPDVPPSPGEADVAHAKKLLMDELLGDFPFVKKSDKAHAVVLLLEQFARALIRGPMPLHDIEAPSAGSGKDLLAHVLCVPYADGVEVSVLAGTEEERRKQITAVAVEGRPFYLLDNIETGLDSGYLSAALTATVWRDRPLGVTKMIRLPVRWSWLMTATNPIMGTQLARRIVRSRLDAKCEEPWLRTGFKHPDLRGWAHEHRAELIWAALVLIQNWLAKGRPEGTKTLGNYESWARVMGGLLDAAGITGFLEDLVHLYDRADAQRGAWRALVAVWLNTHGTNPVKVSDLWPLAVAIDEWDWGRSTTEQGQKVALGHALAGKEGYTFGQHQLVRGEEQHHTQTWRLRSLDEGTPSSSNGDPRAADQPDQEVI